MFAKLGRWCLARLNSVAEVSGLFVRAIKSIGELRNPSRRAIATRIFYRQLYNSGVKATVIVIITSAMIAWLIITQLYFLLPQKQFSIDLFSRGFSLVLLREVGPLLAGIILISRSSATTTFEIGFMKLSKEFEAYNSLRIEPTLLLVLPVIVAFPIALVMMLIVFNLTYLLISWTSMTITVANAPGLFDFIATVRAQLSVEDLLNNLLKALFSGVLIALISIQFGIKVQDKYTDISKAVSNSITGQFLVLLVINIVISLITYRF